MFVGTLYSFGGGGVLEIETNNKNKEEMAKCDPLGVTTLSCACEPVQNSGNR